MSWILSGSNNGVDWFTIDDQSGIDFSSGDRQFFSTSNTSAYQYYRFSDISMDISEGQQMTGTGYNPRIGDVDLYGTDGDVPGPGTNLPPTISHIPDQFTIEDNPTPVVPFTVTDGGDGGELSVYGESDNPSLISKGNIIIKGLGNDRTVQFIPEPNTWGTAHVDITVSDIFHYIHQTVEVHVTPVNDPPTITIPATEFDIVEDADTTPIPPATYPRITTDDADFKGHLVGTQMGSVDITDPNNDQLHVTATLNPPAAGTLNGLSGNGVTYDATTGVWQASGHLDQVNSALAGLTFTPVPNYHGQATLSFDVQDAAGTGPTDVLVTINVLTVNDPPTVTNMNQQHDLHEDASVDLDDIVVFDVDFNSSSTSSNKRGLSIQASGEAITATLTLANPTYGTLTATTGNGETYDAGTGVWRITGDLDQVNGALAGVSFIDAPNNDISTSITTHVEDAAGTGPDDGLIVLNIIPINDPPTISEIFDQITPEDTPTNLIPFTIGDVETSADDLLLTGSSSNTDLIPDENIVFGPSAQTSSFMIIFSEGQRTVTITPAPGQAGTADITITVSDGDLEASTTFTLTVRALPRYTLTTLVADGLGGTVTPETAEYDSCTWVTLTAVPDEGYTFQEWTGDLTGSNNPDSLHMNGDKTVTAHFMQTDVTAPELVNQFPPPDAVSIPVNGNVQFTVQDEGIGVDLATLDVSVNGTPIISDGVDQTGGRVTITSHSPRYTVVYDPVDDFANGSTVTVQVQCADLVNPANTLDTAYDFTCSDGATVTIFASGTVGSAGGQVTEGTTGVQVIVPPGALGDSVEITIGVIENAPPLPDSVEGIGLVLHFGPDGLVFNDSVTIRIPYNQALLDSAGVTDPMDLSVYYYLTSTGEWTILKVVAADAEYFYVKVKQFCYLTVAKIMTGTRVVDDPFRKNLPTGFALYQNHPNPFNPVTTFTFALPERTHVNLSIYNMTGQLIHVLMDETRDTGIHSVDWDASQTGTGIYFYAIRAGSFTQVRKCILMK